MTGRPRAWARTGATRPVSTSRDSTPTPTTHPGGRRLQGLEVGAVARDRVAGAGQQRVVTPTVVLGGQAELRRVGWRLGEVGVGELARPRGQGDEGRHAGAEPLLVVRRLHGSLGGEGAVGVREAASSSGGSWATRVATSSGCAATRASALTAPPLLANRSTGPVAQLGDEGVQVGGVHLGRALVGGVLAHAAPDAARVVRDDRAVGEVRGQGVEAARVHRVARHEQGAVAGIRRRGRAHLEHEVDVGRLEGPGLGRHVGFPSVTGPRAAR